MPKYRKNEILEITWMDCCTSCGWHGEEFVEDEGLLEVYTVGYFLGQSDKTISVSLDRDVNGKRNYTSTIPKSVIKKIRRL